MQLKFAYTLIMHIVHRHNVDTKKLFFAIKV